MSQMNFSIFQYYSHSVRIKITTIQHNIKKQYKCNLFRDDAMYMYYLLLTRLFIWSAYNICVYNISHHIYIFPINKALHADRASSFIINDNLHYIAFSGVFKRKQLKNEPMSKTLVGSLFRNPFLVSVVLRVRNVYYYDCINHYILVFVNFK